MDNEEQLKRRVRGPGKKTPQVQTALRLPTDLLEFYQGFDNASEAMRVALEEYRTNCGGHTDKN